MTITLEAKPARQKRNDVVRNCEAALQILRRSIQIGVVLLCVWIGFEFLLFVRFLESGGTAPFVERPPGAEGFLPISALMSLRYFLLTGEVHGAHPAGLFILLGILAISLVFGKAFCSWLCPFGLLSEMLAKLGDRLFRRRLRVPRWVDAPLRSVKYLLLAYFLYAVLFLMTEAGLRAFLDSPYNQVADVKMWYFFARISAVVGIVVAALALLSIPIRGFWCRYLCPYGALLGIVALASPHKIRRRGDSCIECDQCAKACPALINVARRVPKLAVPIVTVALFMAVTGAAIFTGHWQNRITREEYLHHAEHLESYGHPTSTDSIVELNEASEETTPQKEIR